jgi:hypothetical protein
VSNAALLSCAKILNGFGAHNETHSVVAINVKRAATEIGPTVVQFEKGAANAHI